MARGQLLILDRRLRGLFDVIASLLAFLLGADLVRMGLQENVTELWINKLLEWLGITINITANNKVIAFLVGVVIVIGGAYQLYDGYRKITNQR